MFYNAIGSCQGTTEVELKRVTEELGAQKELLKAIEGMVAVFGAHVVHESGLERVHSHLVLNLSNEEKKVTDLAIKLDKETSVDTAEAGCNWSQQPEKESYVTSCGHSTKRSGRLSTFCEFCGGRVKLNIRKVKDCTRTTKTDAKGDYMETGCGRVIRGLEGTSDCRYCGGIITPLDKGLE